MVKVQSVVLSRRLAGRYPEDRLVVKQYKTPLALQ